MVSIGICGPKGMEPAIVKKLDDAFKDALYDPATQAVMEKFGMPSLYQAGLPRLPLISS